MYLEHYGLSEPPFSITPDPRFVFLGERHRDALAHLLFGVGQGGSGGFVQLTGEVGTGKTTLSRLLLEQLPEEARVALVLNPRQSPIELLQTICEELHVEVPAADRGSSKALVDALNAYLLRAHADGLRVVLIVDEAQDLSVDALEQVRLLTNLETDTRKLLQVILLGQPELRDLLARPELRQLAQRVTARFHLTPLDAGETADYLRHRYRIAGGTRFPFDARAVRRIHHHAGGVPRLVNVVAERALLAGYAHDLATIDARSVDRAAREVLPTAPSHGARRQWPAVAAIATLVMVGLAWTRPWQDDTASSVAADPAPVAATTGGPDAPRAAAPAAAAPSPRPVLDAAALATGIAASDDAAAWTALLALWDATSGSGEGPVADCTPVLADGLYCTTGRARLAKLEALARPALVHVAAGDASRWLLLLGADTDRVRLRMGADDVDVARNAFDAAWTGRYLAPWRGPAALATVMVDPAGPDGDAARAWIAGRLGLAPDSGPADLRAALRRFQSDRGLLADGIAGPETLMALAASEPGPRLLRTLAGD